MMKKSGKQKHDVLIERLFEIFSVLYQGKIIDKTWLCERFAIAERTAYRDLARLGHLLDEVTPGRFRLNAHLLPALHSGHLAQFADFTGVAKLFPRQDGPALRKSLEQRENVIFHSATTRDNQLIEALMGELNQATAAHVEVTYHYQGKPRRAQPYRLINHYGLWYLAAVEAGRLKAFELALITRFMVTETRFTPSPGVLQELNSTPGISFGSKTETLLSVSAHAAKFVGRRPLFPAQRLVEQHEDGRLTIACETRDPQALFRWLRYWLPDIHIIAPVSLRDAFERDLQQRCVAADEITF